MNEVEWLFMVLVILGLFVIFGPLLAIWSVNTLFGLTIPYTLKTWFAAFWLTGGIGSMFRMVSQQNARD